MPVRRKSASRAAQKLLFARGQPLQISRERLHQPASFGAASQRDEALIVATRLQPNSFGCDLDAAEDERLGGLHQRRLIGVVADGKLEVAERRCDLAAGGLEFVDEASVR